MSANNKDTPYGNRPCHPHDPCASLAAFACEHCGGIALFRRVEGGFQQRHCPDHPVMLPDGAIAPGSYLQGTGTPGDWLVWTRLPTGKLDIFGLELPQACIPIDDADHAEA
ncbi:MAG: hypothetical protein HEQ16_09275 [Bosea sp.]|nr:hypothetical protein [Bosea sp. (in: a-proteobacteria)]